MIHILQANEVQIQRAKLNKVSYFNGSRCAVKNKEKVFQIEHQME